MHSNLFLGATFTILDWIVQHRDHTNMSKVAKNGALFLHHAGRAILSPQVTNAQVRRRCCIGGVSEVAFHRPEHH